MRSAQVRVTLATSLALACSSAVKQQADSSMWVAPQAEFLAKVDTIGIGPFWVPDSLEDPAPVRMLFDSLITQRIRLAGYAIVRVPDMWEISDSEIREHRRFDPATGQPEKVSLQLVMEHSMKRLAERYPQVDAFLEPQLVLVGATVEGTTASWDGTEQDFATLGDILLMRGFSGTLPAFSVCVRFWDPTGSPSYEMYHNHGGIELARMPRKAIERSKLFADAERNLNAVRFALKPVLTRPARKPVT